MSKPKNTLNNSQSTVSRVQQYIRQASKVNQAKNSRDSSYAKSDYFSKSSRAVLDHMKSECCFHGLWTFCLGNLTRADRSYINLTNNDCKSMKKTEKTHCFNKSGVVSKYPMRYDSKKLYRPNTTSGLKNDPQVHIEYKMNSNVRNDSLPNQKQYPYTKPPKLAEANVKLVNNLSQRSFFSHKSINSRQISNKSVVKKIAQKCQIDISGYSRYGIPMLFIVLF